MEVIRVGATATPASMFLLSLTTGWHRWSLLDKSPRAKFWSLFYIWPGNTKLDAEAPVPLPLCRARDDPGISPFVE
jgi:hypothetical protein